MNKLPLITREQIVKMLVEGCSLRSITRLTGCSINTVTKLLVDVGRACQVFHYETVKNLNSKKIQCDEIWSFVYAKKKNVPDNKIREAGDIWTWTAIDADSKLIVSWLTGNRDADTAYYFMQDVAIRLKNKVQLTTDGLRFYLAAVADTFGGDIDFAQLVKIYGENTKEENRKYSPAEWTSSKKTPVIGNPNPKDISTSYIERQNLTMRMSMRRFTRLTNAFSKKIENHGYAVALYFVYYNFAKIHQTLRVTPAMEARLTTEIMSIEEILNLVEKYKC
jgi:IS1 family transposase